MEDIITKRNGDTLTPEEFNQIPSELENAIKSAGIDLSSSDLVQLAKTLAVYAAVGDFYSTGGTANAIQLNVVQPRQIPPSYTTGMRVRFIAGAPNTDSVSIKIGELALKSLLDLRGEELQPNSLTEGSVYVAEYDGTDFRLQGDAAQLLAKADTTLANLNNAGKNIVGTLGILNNTKEILNNGIINLEVTKQLYYITPSQNVVFSINTDSLVAINTTSYSFTLFINLASIYNLDFTSLNPVWLNGTPDLSKIGQYILKFTKIGSIIFGECLNNLVSNDATNFTAIGKANIVTFGLPDMTRGQAKTFNTSYTADKKGVLLYTGRGATGAQTLTVNGVEVGNVYNGYSESIGTTMWMIDIGDTYKAVNGGSMTTTKLIFYPFKGV